MAWVVLCLLVFHIVAADVSVQQGELSQVNSSNAILSMSGDTSQKSIWWKFLQSDEEAFLRYLVSVPVREERLGELTDACDKDYLKEIRDKGGLVATRSAAIAEYHSSEHVKDLGTMKMWMWLLAFVCLKMNSQETNPNSCESITPVVLRLTPQDFSKATWNWTRYSPAYFSLWEVLNSSAEQVTNSVPSRIMELPIPEEPRVQGFHVRTLAWETLPNCGNLGINTNPGSSTISLTSKGARLPSPAVVEAQRAGYHFYEGTAKCYSMDDEFRNATGSKFLRLLGPGFLPARLESGCQPESPYLLSNESGFYACLTDTGQSLSWQFYCAHLDCDQVQVEASLVPYFKAVYQAPRNRSDSLVPLEKQSCSSASQVWVRTLHSTSSNFPEAEPDADPRATAPACEPRRAGKPLCLWGIDPPENLLQTSSDVDIINSLFSRLRSSYVSEHISLLNLEQGAPTDFWLVAITLPSAFIAVTAGVVPLTDGLLKLARNLKASSSWFKTALVCCCNLVLAVASYSAVVALTPSELQRQKRFQTWGLHADELPVTNHGLRVMVVIQGESTYKSGSLILAWVSTAVLMPVVLLITLVKCRHEFGAHNRIKNVRLGEISTPTPKRLMRSRTARS